MQELFGDLKVLTDEDKAKADAIKQEGKHSFLKKCVSL